MGHRALVAYRAGDRYRLHYAHWGDGLADAITRRTPFGGRVAADTVRVPDRVAERFDIDSWDGYTTCGEYITRRRVHPRALASDCDPAAVLAAIDPTVESLVVVDPDYAARTYLVCSLGVDGGEPIVVAGPTDDPGALRQSLVTAKEQLGDRVDTGDLSAARARRALRAVLARRVPVSSLDDASFLRTG